MVRDHVDRVAGEDELLAAARSRAEQLGVEAVGPAVAVALTFLTRLLAARTVVEVGTGCGVSGIALLRGMRPDGVLTSIDEEPEHQHTARAGFAADGFSPSRARLINGRALEVLPRLTDAGYDLLLVDPGRGGRADLPRYVEQARRLLRPGGVLVLHGVLGSGPDAGAVADPARRDPVTVALRETTRTLAEDERWTPVLLPLGAGLQAAVLT